jgi:hypothetical protein
MGDHFLPRPPGSAHALAQGPVFVGLSINGAAVAAQEHPPDNRCHAHPPAMGSSPLHKPINFVTQNYSDAEPIPAENPPKMFENP